MSTQDLQERQPTLAEKFIALEEKYGGPIRRPRVKVSPNDPRTPAELRKGTMTGGERMASTGLGHNYAAVYGDALGKYTGHPITLVEVGILAGTGLAMWCDAFPYGRIIGLDIDLSHYAKERTRLLADGAFKALEPIVREYDQLVSIDKQRAVLKDLVVEGSVDVMIDDGFHSSTSIMNTFEAFQPFLAKKATVLIEDNAKVLPYLKKVFPKWDFVGHKTGPRWTDSLIVATRKMK